MTDHPIDTAPKHPGDTLLASPCATVQSLEAIEESLKATAETIEAPNLALSAAVENFEQRVTEMLAAADLVTAAAAAIAGTMTRADWENVARCARERGILHHATGRSWGEWESWQAAQALSGRAPF